MGEDAVYILLVILRFGIRTNIRKPEEKTMIDELHNVVPEGGKWFY